MQSFGFKVGCHIAGCLQPARCGSADSRAATAPQELCGRHQHGAAMAGMAAGAPQEALSSGSLTARHSRGCQAVAQEDVHSLMVHTAPWICTWAGVVHPATDMHGSRSSLSISRCKACDQSRTLPCQWLSGRRTCLQSLSFLAKIGYAAFRSFSRACLTAS